MGPASNRHDSPISRPSQSRTREENRAATASPVQEADKRDIYESCDTYTRQHEKQDHSPQAHQLVPSRREREDDRCAESRALSEHAAPIVRRTCRTGSIQAVRLHVSARGVPSVHQGHARNAQTRNIPKLDTGPNSSTSTKQPRNSPGAVPFTYQLNRPTGFPETKHAPRRLKW